MHAMITVMDKINSHNQHHSFLHNKLRESREKINVAEEKRREGCSNLKSTVDGDGVSHHFSQLCV